MDRSCTGYKSRGRTLASAPNSLQNVTTHRRDTPKSYYDRTRPILGKATEVATMQAVRYITMRARQKGCCNVVFREAVGRFFLSGLRGRNNHPVEGIAIFFGFGKS